jgi:hypothetical protein
MASQTVNAGDAANSNFGGTFVQASGGGNGNYVKFVVTGASFTLQAIPVSSTSPYLRAPVNGLQLIPR